MGYRVLALGGGLAVLVLFTNLSVGVAQDPGRRDKELDVEAVIPGIYYQGKISRVDVKARVLIFDEMMRYNARAKASSGTSGAPRRAIDLGTGNAGPPVWLGMVTANVPPDAVILIDGKEGTLKDLKEGALVRIQVPPGGIIVGALTTRSPFPIDIRPGEKMVGRTVTVQRIEITLRSPEAEKEKSRSSGPGKP